MELMLTFRLPQSIMSDGEGEFTAQFVGNLCEWFNVALNDGPTDFVRGQGTAERMGGCLQKAMSILCQRWPFG